MWTSEIVRIRFVEAADTVRYLPAERMGRGNGYWPQHLYDGEDRAGWDDQAKADNAEKAKGRAPDGAIGRHDECLQWTSAYIADEKRRKLVWGFARCRANKWDFGKLCERNGWVRSTSYDRLNKLWDRLSAEFCNINLLLRPPSDFWIGHETANQPVICATVAGRDVSPSPKVPAAVIYEKSRDLIRTEQDAQAFAKHLARHNSRARREQERREARLLAQIEAA